jgi:hypothetical protein
MSAAISPADILDRVRRIQADTAGVMEAARWVEWILAHRFHAAGTGIHSRVTAVQHLLGSELVADLRYLGTVRNDFAHNPLAAVRQPDRFTQTAQRVVRRLLEMPGPAAPRAAVAPDAIRMPFVAGVAGFWTVVVLAVWMVGEQPPREAGTGQAPAAVPARASVAPGAEIIAGPRARPAGARTDDRPPRAPAPAPAPARPTVEAAAARAPVTQGTTDDGELSVEDLRKLKSSF